MTPQKAGPFHPSKAKAVPTHRRTLNSGNRTSQADALPRMPPDMVFELFEPTYTMDMTTRLSGTTNASMAIC